MDDLGTLVIVFLAGIIVGHLFFSPKKEESSLVNEETIEWVDRKGRQRKIVVHRRVRSE